eukprot:CCRYP_014288-RB/>CCRYP_014288-RB protein AED:0.17 eAED:0.17 QI:266/1/1/1/0.5/0.33/3/859/387
MLSNGTAATAAAFICVLSALSSSVVPVEGWRRSRFSVFVPSPSTLFLKDQVIFNMRGGSSIDDTSLSDAAEEEDEVVLVDENRIDSVADTSFDSSDTNATQRPSNLTFPATNPHDGSDSDPDGIPTRFLQMKKDNRAEAKEAWEAHLLWRQLFQVDTLLSRPHKLFDVCKAMVPHYFAGRDPHNNVIFVQRPAMLDFELMRRNNATMEDLLLHYVYVIEYCWNILDPSPPEKVMTNIVDMKGLSFRNMRNQQYIGFGKRFVQMMSSNYPGRSYKTLIINAPSWFHALYKMFKPLLRESTRQKIVIFKSGEKQDTALKFYLGDSVPRDLISTEETTGGKESEVNGRYFLPVNDISQCEPGPNSNIEYEMRQFCLEQLKLHNETMQDVV